MDAREIEEKSKALRKADENRADAEVFIGIFNELRKGIRASEKTLRETKIGVTVNKFKQSKIPEVARAATDLVRKWRDEVEREKNSKGGANGSRKPSSQGGGTTPQSGTASPAPATKAKTESSVPPDKRTWKTDKVDINRTGGKGRDACIGLMYDGLVYLTTHPASTVLQVAMSVEEAAYKKLQPETSSAYKDKMRMLFQNLKNKANPSLRTRVLRGEITPDRLINMTHEELKSKDQLLQDKEMMEENLREAQVLKEEKAIDTTIQCGKCGERKVSYTQAQTRSADEPMTTFCTCTVCGKRWKQ